ncbi:MAG: Gfo/Idh/MocA family oxidoreductase [Verrucomicrobia bacterium]|nr:Gfo/Idh/MocA family oxidoreductase [Verrucomicrobiota bacterium]
MTPSKLNRRDFLKTTSLTGLALAAPSLNVLGANDDLRLAVIGLGGKGGQHVERFSQAPGVRVTALGEPDPKRLAAHADKLKQRGTTAFTATDPRLVLEREDVDAVVIATPNHWHALLTVWALRAGKDVYVEKPISHSVGEGARMVEETQRAGRIVQSGTQYRSCPGLRGAAAWLREGHIGKPLWAHIVWFEHRPPIGKCAPFIPTDLDYDLWCGPAPLEPLTRPKLHYDWHWFWSTGDGDLGNSGIHAFDACRMFIPGAVFPRRLIGLGGRFTYDDAAETPNTQFTLMEYPQLPIVLENRNLSMEKDAVVMDRFRGVQEGFVLQYEGGYFAGFRLGGAVFDNTGKEIRRFRGDNGEGHQANFLKALRSRKTSDLNAPIHEGHVSSAVCHLGNLSYRLGRPGDAQACQAKLGDRSPVAEGFPRLVKSLEGIGVDLAKTPFSLGPWLELDTQTGDILGTEGGDAGQLEQARRLARGTHRAPYAFPA